MLEGARAQMGEPVLLDLGGLGIRALSWWRGRYLIAGGPVGEGSRSRLFVWPGQGPARALDEVDLTDFQAEGFFSPEDRDEILVLSDDGGRLLDGVPCKDLDEPARKRFRGLWLSPGPAR